jgi:hypothetical protein
MSLRARVEKLFHAFGSNHLFGGTGIKELSRWGYLSTKGRAKRKLAPHNVRQRARFDGARFAWGRLKGPDSERRRDVLAKMGLPPDAMLEEARQALIQSARECGFSAAEIAALERALRMPQTISG